FCYGLGLVEQQLGGLFHFQLLPVAKDGVAEYFFEAFSQAVFGDTIFGYWQQLKMKKATQLLLDKSQTIAEISREMGYKNPQHFSTAFKKHFGHSPSERRG
ncbi:MAG: AraC family transcriptional regulator, partial [Bacteroidota bacterium]